MGEHIQLPWKSGDRPLMLAPMQGITNRALRSLFIERYAPDVVFTEYVLVRSGVKKPVAKTDCQEVMSSGVKNIPLVVQLIGSDTKALIAAAKIVQDLGAKHININLGCPYGRMANKTAGGALLREPSRLAGILSNLRPHIQGSFSVKVRSGLEDSSELSSLLDLFEDSGVDFIIVHPRTVVQQYGGIADHRVTAAAVTRLSLPIIANGDIFTAEDGQRVFEETGAAGLMLGRGAIADPFLFERIRGRYDAVSSPEMRSQELQEYLRALLGRYTELFCGDQQVLWKMKEVVAQIQDPAYRKTVRQLLKSKRIDRFVELLDGFI
jgi:tRNA-dihydrouridine synthase